MRSNNKQLSQPALLAAIAWLILVTGYMVWGAAVDRGLYGWLVAWQAAGGGYAPTLTFAVPLILLALPALWPFFGHLAALDNDRKRNASAQRQAVIGWAHALLALALLAAIGAGGSLLMALNAPSEDAEPIILTQADLARTGAPLQRVRMMGDLKQSPRFAVRESGRFGAARSISYQGFIPEDTMQSRPTGAPFQIFVEGQLPAVSSPGQIADIVQVTGFLVKDGLPPYARTGLQRQGVAIAQPHYVLRQTSARTAWLTGFGISAFAAFMLGAIGAALLARAALTA